MSKVTGLEVHGFLNESLQKERQHDDIKLAPIQEQNAELFGLSMDSTTVDKLTVLLFQSYPVVVSYFLIIGSTLIILVFAGHYQSDDTDEKSVIFAGISLGIMFSNVSSLSLLVGMTSAVETLGSQHNGAGNYREVGFVLQRSCLILGFLTVPVVIVWLFFAEIFFLYIGVDSAVCEVIGVFLKVRALGVPIDVVNQSYEKYLMSIGVMKPSMYANIVFNVSLLVLNAIFVFVLQLDYSCLAWSFVVSSLILTVTLVWLSWSHVEVQRTLQPWGREAFHGWYEFICLGMHGTVMICSEWWAYEMLTVFAARLGTVEVAVQTIVLQTVAQAFTISVGISIAAGSLVGNFIGAKEHSLAVSIGQLSLFSGLVVEVLIGILLLVSGKHIMSIYSDDTAVNALACKSIPIMAVFIVLDGMSGIASGILRGAGKQLVGSVTKIIAFWVIGIPLAYYMCFTHGRGVNGLIEGIAFGTAIQSILIVVMIVFWEEYVYTPAITGTNSKSDEGDDNHNHSQQQQIICTMDSPMSKIITIGGLTNKNRSSGGSSSRGHYQQVMASDNRTVCGMGGMGGDDHCCDIEMT